MALAAADLLFVITDPSLNQINSYYFPSSFLSLTPVCSVKHVLRAAAQDCCVWFTVTFSFDRFVAISCQKLKTTYCTGKTAAVDLETASILLCVKNIPGNFTYEPRKIIDNVPWFCNTKTSAWTNPGWVGFSWFDKILIPLLPFGLILLINSLTDTF